MTKLKLMNIDKLKTGACHLLLLVGLLQFASCNKFLDKQPQTVIPVENYYKTEAQLNSALTGVYVTLASDNLFAYSIWGVFGVPTDESLYKNSTLFNGPQVLNFSSSNSYIYNTWQDLYEGINRANLLLDNINKPSMKDSNRNVIKGQALFLRSFYYFMLVSNWGDVPMPLHATNSPDSISSPRIDSKLVYEQIINDMTIADSLVAPITNYGFGGRVTKSAVEGILARVCLFRAGFPFTDDHSVWYSKSLYWSNKVINSGIHSLNPSYSQVFINHCQNKSEIKESIWEVEFYGTGIGNPYPQPSKLGSYNGILCNDLDTGFSYAQINVQAKLFNAFADNTQLVSSDKRRDWSISPYSFNTVNGVTTKKDFTVTSIYNRSAAKWRREYELSANKTKNNTSINFALLRYSDILLMKAEAENELNNGPTSADIEAVNQVRRRGYGLVINTPSTVTDLPSTINYGSFQQAVYDERYRELCFEGLRRNDLIRWGMYVATMKDLANFITTSAPANFKFAALAGNNIQNKHVLFPIPINEISLNPGIGRQNPGW